MKSFSRPLRFAIALSMAFTAASVVRANIGYQFVTVGNPGNAPDTVAADDGSGNYGAVSYVYDIGKYDVTLNQYTTFLNAVATSDPYGLYNGNLATDLLVAGIARNGSSGSYTYSVIGDGNRPATYISWFDAARFTNWIQNGQPTGLGEVASTTEQGAYMLNGATSGIITRDANARYWIPTENEWYKAAYYDPTLNGGAGGYWTYATRSNTVPGNNAQNPTLANQTNYNNGVFSVTQSASLPTGNALTDVGLFSNSASYYGTYDQNGDAYNWNDSIVANSARGNRGGPWNGNEISQQSTSRYADAPTLQDHGYSFRIATVPEPSSILLMASGVFLPLLRRRRDSKSSGRCISSRPRRSRCGKPPL